MIDRPAGDVARRLTPVVRAAPAKLNLTLAVGPRRGDGYHELHSVMVPLAFGDRLSIAPAAGAVDSLHVTGGPDGTAPLDPVAFDSVLRAVAETRRALGRAVATFPLAIRLEKRIPVAAGLAGGSSDAAAAMDGALEAWGAGLDMPIRRAVAATIGSDVPFFLAGRPALVTGRGERVEPLRNLTGEPAGVLLVTPRVPGSTAAVFAAFDTHPDARASDPRSTRMSSEHLADELAGGLRSEDLVARAGILAVSNDLARAADVVVPGLRALRRGLTRILGAPIGLSGSGPTLWALYPSGNLAQAGAAKVAAAIVDGTLAAPGTEPPVVVATTIQAAGGGSQP